MKTISKRLSGRQAQQRGPGHPARGGVRRRARGGRREDAEVAGRGRQPAQQVGPDSAARRRHERDRVRFGRSAETEGHRRQQVR